MATNRAEDFRSSKGRNAQFSCYAAEQIGECDMRHVLLIGLALLGAGCTPDPDASPASEPSEALTTTPSETPTTSLPDSFAETAWRSEADDGTRYVTYIDADGTYRDLRNGDPWQTGTWTYDKAGEHRLCFTPDDKNGVERCWKPEKMHGQDMDVVGGPDAQRVELEQVDYVARGKEGKKPA